MLDIKLLRGNIDFVAEQLKRRNFTFDVAEFNKLEDQRKVIQVQTQDLQNLRNTKSKAIGQAKASGESMQPLLAACSNSVYVGSPYREKWLHRNLCTLLSEHRLFDGNWAIAKI